MDPHIVAGLPDLSHNGQPAADDICVYILVWCNYKYIQNQLIKR